MFANTLNATNLEIGYFVTGATRLVVIVACFTQVACWSLAASRQAKKIRAAYVQATISKGIGWFDVNSPMQLATKVADSTAMIQEAR